MRVLATVRGRYHVVAISPSMHYSFSNQGGVKGKSKGKDKDNDNDKPNGKDMGQEGQWGKGSSSTSSGSASRPVFRTPGSTASGSTRQHGPRFKRARSGVAAPFNPPTVCEGARMVAANDIIAIDVLCPDPDVLTATVWERP